MLQLRPYQQRAIDLLRAEYAAGLRAPVLVSPCGSGKTIISAAIIRSAAARGTRSLFLAGRIELLEQTINKLVIAGIENPRLIQADNDIGDPSSPVTVASVPTLTTKRWQDRLPEAGLVIFDECQHGPAAGHARIAQAYSTSKLLGLTATPCRGDGRALGDVFDSIVVGATVQELQALGALVPCRIFSAPETTSSRDLALSPVEAYEQHAAGQRTIVFCTTVSHAERLTAEFSMFGIAADIVHGELAADDRRERLARFRNGETRVLCNVGILIEGFDDPEVAVVILARRFGNAGTFIQVVGRAMRPAPGKQSATVVDLCGSVLEHGTPDAERTYSLDGKGISSARQSIRQCPRCGGVFLAGPASCPMCAGELPTLARQDPRSRGIGVVEVAPRTPPRPWFVVIRARHPGICPSCRLFIARGSEIVWAKGQKPMHVACAPNGALIKRHTRRAA